MPAHIDVCEEGLVDIDPAITTEPLAFVLGRVLSFCCIIRSLIGGKLDTATLLQDNRKLYTAFGQKMSATAPFCVPYQQQKKFDQLPLELFSAYRSWEVTPRQQITLDHVRRRFERYPHP